jgi:hypothetical protein
MHPFESIPPDGRARLFRRVLVLTFIIQTILIVSGKKLESQAAPMAILSYEFAGTPEAANAMVTSWENHRTAMHVNLWVDYLFMPAYSCSIALGVIWAKNVLNLRNWPLGSIASLLAWGQWFAAICDAFENAGLIYFSFREAFTPLPQLVWWLAAIKFAFVIGGILYAGYGLTARVLGTPRS